MGNLNPQDLEDLLLSTLHNTFKLTAFRPGQRKSCECQNNDQRRANVSQHMTARFEEPKPSGPIVLFDDYIITRAYLVSTPTILFLISAKAFHLLVLMVFP